MHPTGEQYTIAAAETRAVITPLGAVLRSFSVDGVAHVPSTDPAAPPPRGAGAVLVPWPNRTAGATWRWR